MTNDLFLLKHSNEKQSVLQPDHESLGYHFDYPMIYAFLEKKIINSFLSKIWHREVGKFETISFTPSIYEIEINSKKFNLCQAPLGAPAATQLLDWLIAYGTKKILAIGSAGSLVDLPENAYFLVKRAIRDEGTSFHYLPAKNEIELDYDFRKELLNKAKENSINLEEVVTWTTDGFFRETENKIKLAMSYDAKLVEMECSALAACSKFRGVKFAQILFTADSLADVNEHESRTWGELGSQNALELAIKLLS
ncbi:uridine phosphorylase [Lactobacillus colini]|uniref:Uridine phosphorylase n=1 Tax=Lactobacillus colini TaxID=1819254 RepID=A0ABS4MDI4_9LACO|nr:nucleoside phosphorylase [Lactobacillus colini]MBP2057743.1 uridine phosphorylase [Lactobacillus colini]